MAQVEVHAAKTIQPAPKPRRSGISVVIPSWNGRHLLEKHLPSVVNAAAAYGGSGQTEIIVVDDACSDGTHEWLSAHFPAVRVETNARNLGFAPTANRGVQAARHPLVYLVNNDVAIEPSTLPPLADHFEDPNVFAVGGQVHDYDTGALRGAGQIGTLRRGFLGVHRRYFVRAAGEPESFGETSSPWLTLFATGGSSMFRREQFLTLGGFDEAFAPFGWEDVELSLRAWKQGLEVHYEPRSRVRHQFSSTIAPKFSRRQVRAVYERNRLLAHWLHLDSPASLAANGAFLAIKLIGSVFAGRWEMWSAAAQAIARLDVVRTKRREYRSRQARTLAQVLSLVAGQVHRPGAEELKG